MIKKVHRSEISSIYILPTRVSAGPLRKGADWGGVEGRIAE